MKGIIKLLYNMIFNLIIVVSKNHKSVYPLRVNENLQLNKVLDNHTIFGDGTARGYTDYPHIVNYIKI